MATARDRVRGESRSGARPLVLAGAAHRGFTLVDLLVSLTVIAVLIGLLLPSLSLVRETTRRVICSSNLRQSGLGLAMYADDYRGSLPLSKFLPQDSSTAAMSTPAQAQNVMLARLESPDYSWDGLGYLFALDYLDQYGVFYCPSHHGDNPVGKFAPLWSSGARELVINYHYRATRNVALRSPNSALVSDGLRTAQDYNHKVGANVLRNDFSAFWFDDASGAVAARLPTQANDAEASNKIEDIWSTFDGQR